MSGLSSFPQGPTTWTALADREAAWSTLWGGGSASPSVDSPRRLFPAPTGGLRFAPPRGIWMAPCGRVSARSQEGVPWIPSGRLVAQRRGGAQRSRPFGRTRSPSFREHAFGRTSGTPWHLSLCPPLFGSNIAGGLLRPRYLSW